jgi:hypothetical protein
MKTRGIFMLNKSIFIASSLLCAMALCFQAEASPVHKKTLETEQEDVTVPMSQTDIETSLEARLDQAERNHSDPSSLEMGVSSWTPKNLAISSTLANPNAFGTQVPEVEFSFLTPMHLSRSDNFNWKFGVGLMSLTRDETINVSSQNFSDQQTAYLASLKVGAEYLPKQFANRSFSPYASLSLVPTFIATSRSALDDGGSQFGVPVEFQTGALVHLIKAADLNIGFDGVLGKASSSNLSGVGVNAGVRVSL